MFDPIFVEIQVIFLLDEERNQCNIFYYEPNMCNDCNQFLWTVAVFITASIISQELKLGSLMVFSAPTFASDWFSTAHTQTLQLGLLVLSMCICKCTSSVYHTPRTHTNNLQFSLLVLSMCNCTYKNFNLFFEIYL